MERRLVSCRREGIGSRLRLLVFILIPLLLSFFLSGTALALDTIGNPGNTTIDIYDYYVYIAPTLGDENPKQTVYYDNANDKNRNYSGYTGINDTGINEGHTLLFLTDTDPNHIWNYWPGYSGGAWVQSVLCASETK